MIIFYHIYHRGFYHLFYRIYNETYPCAIHWPLKPEPIQWKRGQDRTNKTSHVQVRPQNPQQQNRTGTIYVYNYIPWNIFSIWHYFPIIGCTATSLKHPFHPVYSCSTDRPSIFINVCLPWITSNPIDHGCLSFVFLSLQSILLCVCVYEEDSHEPSIHFTSYSFTFYHSQSPYKYNPKCWYSILIHVDNSLINIAKLGKYASSE